MQSQKKIAVPVWDNYLAVTFRKYTAFFLKTSTWNPFFQQTITQSIGGFPERLARVGGAGGFFLTKMEDYVIAQKDVIALLLEAFKIGFESAKEALGKQPKYISQREAFRRFTKQKVNKWEKFGLITSDPGGNGENSKYSYSYIDLLNAAASEKIIIRKVKNKI